MTNKPAPERSQSFLEHLEELRSRLLKSFLALVICACVGFYFAESAVTLLIGPIERAQSRVEAQVRQEILQVEILEDNLLRVRNPEVIGILSDKSPIAIYLKDSEEPLRILNHSSPPPVVYLRPMDPFMIELKAALLLGVIFSLPFMLYQLWAFIAPGLLPKERRMAVPMILAGSMLFPLGATFAYFLLEISLMFFWQFIVPNTAVMNDAREYLSFVLIMMVAFGAVFEFPLAVVLATRVGLVSVDWLSARRGPIFIVLLVVAALITPSGDPVTLLALALPLQLLFEISLVVSRILDRVGGASAEEENLNDTDSEPEA